MVSKSLIHNYAYNVSDLVILTPQQTWHHQPNLCERQTLKDNNKKIQQRETINRLSCHVQRFVLAQLQHHSFILFFDDADTGIQYVGTAKKSCQIGRVCVCVFVCEPLTSKAGREEGREEDTGHWKEELMTNQKQKTENNACSQKFHWWGSVGWMYVWSHS